MSEAVSAPAAREGDAGSGPSGVSPGGRSPETVVIRCDAGPRVGVGHLVRCRRLAAVLGELGGRCVMVGPSRDHAEPGDGAAFDDWIERSEWGSSRDDAEALVTIARDRGARFAVLDDYRVDGTYQEVMLGAGLRWMQQFDASRPQAYWADMVVNASPYETMQLHADELRRPGAVGLFGPRYAILRPEFPPAGLRPAARPVNRALVTFGGGDDLGLVVRAVAALLDGAPGLARIVVVSGAKNPRNAEIAAWIGRHSGGRVDLQVNPPDVAAIYASCDLAVAAAGTTGHELASCGTPMILLAMADNQERQGAGWRALGAAVYLGRASEVGDAELRKAIAALCADDERRARMAGIGPALVDGEGARRLAACLLQGVVQ